MVTQGNTRVDKRKGVGIQNDDNVQVWPLNLRKCAISPGAKITGEGTPRGLTGPSWLRKHELRAVGTNGSWEQRSKPCSHLNLHDSFWL